MKGLLLIAAIFILSYLAGHWLQQGEQETGELHKSSCDPSEQLCRETVAENQFELLFDGEPSPLVPFNVVVTSLQAEILSMQVTFEMEGMDMGFNQYSLEQVGNQWRARVILPVCSQSRGDWLMNLKIKTPSKTSVVQFSFAQ